MRAEPSRRRLLPPPSGDGEVRWGALAIFLLLLSGLLGWAWMELGWRLLWVAGGLFATVLLAMAGEQKRLRLVAASREGESICSFARAFDCRRTDTVILRAVHEEVQGLLEPVIPLRPDDRLVEDLRLDDEDIDELVWIAAHRAGRSLVGSETNPLHGKIHTVGDLVAFLARQPELARA